MQSAELTINIVFLALTLSLVFTQVKHTRKALFVNTGLNHIGAKMFFCFWRGVGGVRIVFFVLFCYFTICAGCCFKHLM